MSTNRFRQSNAVMEKANDALRRLIDLRSSGKDHDAILLLLQTHRTLFDEVASLFNELNQLSLLCAKLLASEHTEYIEAYRTQMEDTVYRLFGMQAHEE